MLCSIIVDMICCQKARFCLSTTIALTTVSVNYSLSYFGVALMLVV
jgi:hypothetical protein